MQLAALFLFLFSIALTLSPAARLHTWQTEYRWEHWIGFAVWLVGCALVHRQIIKYYPERDPFIFPVAMLLAGWGLLTIWRLNPIMGLRQTIWLAICLLVIWLALRVTNLLALLRRYKYLWLTGGLLLTGLTFVFGVYPGGVGPRLWLGCCGVYLQPSEPLKLLLIVYMAAYLADRLPISLNLATLLTPTLILGGTALALLVAQRDLGTASLFILIYTVIVYMASGNLRIPIISGLTLLVTGLGGYLLFDVVRIRVDAWLNPWLDPSGRSYQIVQSLMAVAAGGILGRGPGLGSPGVVPVSHSDFIFSSIVEEMGLLGAIGLLLCMGLLVNRGFRIAMYSPNIYQRLLASGLTSYLAIQTIFIIGGNLRLLPLTGVTLPFVSYGGSSLLTSSISLLLLLRISYPDDEEETPAPLPQTQPYFLVSAGLFTGLLALGLITGWWAGIRSDDIVTRTDNPRRSINDRYVRRGALLDRNNQSINYTDGAPGGYERIYSYPPLSPTTGYNSPQFGLAGLEAGLDDFLRGLRGNPTSDIIWQYLLYGQPPPGLNVRLTIDLQVQQAADDLLGGHKGALVMLNAKTGEILAMASHPYFDPTQLESTWDELIQDENAPLLNRATQGQYPPGTALGPFLLSYFTAQRQAEPDSLDSSLPPVPLSLSYRSEERTWECARRPLNTDTWGDLIASGCPGPLVRLSESMDTEDLEALFESLGFYQVPQIELPSAPLSEPSVNRLDLAAIGQENLTVTPLQMALAAAALSNNGILPGAHIASSVQTPHQGWVVLGGPEPQDSLLVGATETAQEELRQEQSSYWQVVAKALSSDDHLTWYLAGTLPEWQGPPLALAIVLEEDNPELAEHIGQTLLEETVTSAE